jgi:hypothetical protein
MYLPSRSLQLTMGLLTAQFQRTLRDSETRHERRPDAQQLAVDACFGYCKQGMKSMEDGERWEGSYVRPQFPVVPTDL